MEDGVSDIETGATLPRRKLKSLRGTENIRYDSSVKAEKERLKAEEDRWTSLAGPVTVRYIDKENGASK